MKAGRPLVAGICSDSYSRPELAFNYPVQYPRAERQAGVVKAHIPMVQTGGSVRAQSDVGGFALEMAREVVKVVAAGRLQRVKTRVFAKNDANDTAAIRVAVLVAHQALCAAQVFVASCVAILLFCMSRSADSRAESYMPTKPVLSKPIYGSGLCSAPPRACRSLTRQLPN